jgi:hypothetical protein
MGNPAALAITREIIGRKLWGQLERLGGVGTSEELTLDETVALLKNRNAKAREAITALTAEVAELRRTKERGRQGRYPLCHCQCTAHRAACGNIRVVPQNRRKRDDHSERTGT